MVEGAETTVVRCPRLFASGATVRSADARDVGGGGRDEGIVAAMGGELGNGGATTVVVARPRLLVGSALGGALAATALETGGGEGR